ncbi:MAG: hypothetical protein JNK14_01185 [Chitinophagaceae bacterium]|nr:hypothetical protein [Chitinophagaceae bacterium]
MSIPREYHQTKAFKILLSAIRKHFAEAGIPVLDYPTESIYLFCPPQHKKIKRVAMIGLTERHPELRYCLNKELRNKNKYYLKLFEAVAVATLQEEKK